MDQRVSKSRLKARALEFFRLVERTGRSLVITDRGRAVLRIVPVVEDPEEAMRGLEGTVQKYEDPTEPVGVADWEVLK